MATATTNRINPQDIPCYVTDLNDYHYSTDWGNRLVDIWISAKRTMLAENLTVDVFHKMLQSEVLEALDIEQAFFEGCSSLGIDGETDSQLYDDYLDIQMKQVFSVIPDNLYAEMCWIPGWDGISLDSLIDSYGVRSDTWRSSYIEEVVPGQWLECFLKMVNCSSVDLIAAAIEQDEKHGRKFAEKCAKLNFKVDKDQNRLSILSGSGVVSAIENGAFGAIPMCHAEINVRALFKLDPTKAMRWTTVRDEVHVGFHEFVNGAGYMDTYPGEVIISADQTGFAGQSRWKWGINKVYGIYRPVFFVTPEAVA